MQFNSSIFTIIAIIVILDPSGPFSQFFFRFTAFFANISLTDVEDKDYELAVIEANVCTCMNTFKAMYIVPLLFH